MLKIILALVASASSFAKDPQLPYSPSLNLTSMNREISPCTDFFQYACGGWLKKNPIPGDQASWDVYAKLGLDNQKFIHQLLAEAAKPSSKRTPSAQKIGDYFHACMDEAAVEKAGLKPIEARLARIEAIQTLGDLSAHVMTEHQLGANALFNITADQDFSNSQDVIAFANRGALGLPDRDYYTKTDPKSVEIRNRYIAYLADDLERLGDAKEKATQEAHEVMDLETKLAKAMFTRTELRDPRKLFHKTTIAKFKKSVRDFSWDAYIKDMGLSDSAPINVTEPRYFAEVNKQLKKTPLAVWKNFLRISLLHETAPFLSKKYDDSRFAFYGTYLHGIKEQRPRWRRCALWTDDALGEALGQVFVEKTFSPDTKARTVKMTKQIEEAMASELKTLPWMGEATRKQALEKLESLVNKVGYPEKWRDYSALTIKPDDFSGNVERANVFEVRRVRAKIGKPLDRSEWGMTPPTVNAYYNAQMNDINFPAGVLQPPLFDPKMDDAPNYGNTGSTIGHELTHAFDDEGRRFDAKGNLRDWWTKKDGKEFEKRAKCVSDQYSGYIAVDDIHINGKLTNGEDIADLGGTVLAYLAWKHATETQRLKPIDGLTPDQRFFIGMAQWACGDVRPETKRDQAITNPHSPLEYRVNGVVSNMPEFAQAFSCKKGDAMVRENTCRVW